MKDVIEPDDEGLAESLASDFAEVAELAAQPEQLELFLGSVLDVLSDAVPYDIALFVKLEAGLPVLKCARGPLADRLSASMKLTPEAELLLGRLLEKGTITTDPSDRSFVSGIDLPDDHSCLVVPLVAGDEPQGVITFQTAAAGRYDPESIGVAEIYGHLVGLGVAAARRTEELERLRRLLEEQNRLLVEEAVPETDASSAFEAARSKIMRRLVHMAKQVAVTDAPVLITGETGTGKELAARAIHGWSRRGDGAFVQVNCAALPENLIESELFGHRRGGFSGAVDDRLGRFRLADGGTLLLDEVGDLPLGTQVKLLRVLQEGSLEPVGSDRTHEVDVRIIAATNVDLERAIDKGSFREDLFYRLNVFPLHLPPLRERSEDIPLLTARILERARRRTGRGPWTVSNAQLRRMRGYDWPGNIRELVNTLERARVLNPVGGRLKLDLGGGRRPAKVKRMAESWPTLKDYERDYIEKVLQKTGGKIYGEDGAASLLKIPPTTLQSKIRRLGVRKPTGK